jgi:hypothetical protein
MTDSALNEGATIENALHTHELRLGGWMLFVIWLILFIIGRKPSRIPKHSLLLTRCHRAQTSSV